MFEAISLVIPLDPKNELKIINEIIICSIKLSEKLIKKDFLSNFPSKTTQSLKKLLMRFFIIYQNTLGISLN